MDGGGPEFCNKISTQQNYIDCTSALDKVSPLFLLRYGSILLNKKKVLFDVLLNRLIFI